MISILTVTTAADDPTLLTLAELRQATGVETGQDTELAALGRSVSAAIASRCNVRVSGATPATLRAETLTEVFRLECPTDKLILARRPVTSIASVVEDGTTLDAEDYETDTAPGFLRRLCSDYPSWWAGVKVTVVYVAGWATVPENLRSAAMKLAKVLWAENVPGDPNAKRILIPDVYEIERWVPQGDDPLMSREIDELLRDYINPAIG